MHINTNRQIVIDVRMVFIFASSYLCVCVCVCTDSHTSHITAGSKSQRFSLLKDSFMREKCLFVGKVSPSVCVGERGCGS